MRFERNHEVEQTTGIDITWETIRNWYPETVTA